MKLIRTLAMKKVFFAFLQFALFLLIFFVGSLANPFRQRWSVSHPTLTSTHYFVPDGLLLMTAFYLLLLAIEAMRKRLLRSGLWTSIAFFLALIFGFLAKFGSVTHDLY
jgi:hypothetical protein